MRVGRGVARVRVGSEGGKGGGKSEGGKGGARVREGKEHRFKGNIFATKILQKCFNQFYPKSNFVI